MGGSGELCGKRLYMCVVCACVLCVYVVCTCVLCMRVCFGCLCGLVRQMDANGLNI